MRYERSISIIGRHQELLALIRKGDYSSPLLAAKLRVSEPTVYRDILFLKRQGHRIKPVRYPDHWAYRLDPNDASSHLPGAA